MTPSIFAYVAALSGEAFHLEMEKFFTSKHTHHSPDIGRTFKPDVCCAHNWQGHTENSLEWGCTKCGATCTRDAAGAIVEFDAYPQLEGDHGF